MALMQRLATIEVMLNQLAKPPAVPGTKVSGLEAADLLLAIRDECVRGVNRFLRMFAPDGKMRDILVGGQVKIGILTTLTQSNVVGWRPCRIRRASSTMASVSVGTTENSACATCPIMAEILGSSGVRWK